MANGDGALLQLLDRSNQFAIEPSAIFTTDGTKYGRQRDRNQIRFRALQHRIQRSNYSADYMVNRVELY
jgi:hypothetical protein